MTSGCSKQLRLEKCRAESSFPMNHGLQGPSVSPDIHQSEIASTNLYDSGAEVWAKNCVKIPWHFRASFTVQNGPQTSSEFVTPCLVADISKSHLRELLGLGGASPSAAFNVSFYAGLGLPQGPFSKNKFNST